MTRNFLRVVPCRDTTLNVHNLLSTHHSKNNRIEGLRRRIFAHMTTSPPKPVPRELRALGNDIFPDADPFGNKRGLDYVKTADVTEDDTDKVVVDDPHSKIIDADDENLVDLDQMKKVLRNIDKYLKKNKKK